MCFVEDIICLIEDVLESISDFASKSWLTCLITVGALTSGMIYLKNQYRLRLPGFGTFGTAVTMNSDDTMPTATGIGDQPVNKFTGDESTYSQHLDSYKTIGAHMYSHLATDKSASGGNNPHITKMLGHIGGQICVDKEPVNRTVGAHTYSHLGTQNAASGGYNPHITQTHSRIDGQSGIGNDPVNSYRTVGAHTHSHLGTQNGASGGYNPHITQTHSRIDGQSGVGNVPVNSYKTVGAYTHSHLGTQNGTSGGYNPHITQTHSRIDGQNSVGNEPVNSYRTVGAHTHSHLGMKNAASGGYNSHVTQAHPRISGPSGFGNEIQTLGVAGEKNAMTSCESLGKCRNITITKSCEDCRPIEASCPPTKICRSYSYSSCSSQHPHQHEALDEPIEDNFISLMSCHKGVCKKNAECIKSASRRSTKNRKPVIPSIPACCPKVYVVPRRSCTVVKKRSCNSICTPSPCCSVLSYK